jgi:pimeloyl-ACP methyl ester carboxylesterase
MLPVAGGKYKVWTKKQGSGPTKVLRLHGGPGFSHEYLEAFESFLPQAGIEMYYYDQLGCNNSDQPEDSSLWTLPRYAAEVEEVRSALGLGKFVLYGHSWGGILAIEYALQHPEHLSGVVISNMTAGVKSYLKRTAALKQQLPPATSARSMMKWTPRTCARWPASCKTQATPIAPMAATSACGTTKRSISSSCSISCARFEGKTRLRAPARLESAPRIGGCPRLRRRPVP